MGRPAAQIGIGPALHVNRIREGVEPSGLEKAWTNHTTLGFVARGRVAVPARSRLFVDLRAEYHFTGHVDVGPYTPAALFGGNPLTLPSTPVSFNYGFIAVGPGIRF
jgi:hypothetical protein